MAEPKRCGYCVGRLDGIWRGEHDGKYHRWCKRMMNHRHTTACYPVCSLRRDQQLVLDTFTPETDVQDAKGRL